MIPVPQPMAPVAPQPMVPSPQPMVPRHGVLSDALKRAECSTCDDWDTVDGLERIVSTALSVERNAWNKHSRATAEENNAALERLQPPLKHLLGCASLYPEGGPAFDKVFECLTKCHRRLTNLSGSVFAIRKPCLLLRTPVWRPALHAQFPLPFRVETRLLLLCIHRRRELRDLTLVLIGHLAQLYREWIPL